MKTHTKILQVANIVAFLAVLVVNTLASTVGINGRLTGALSDGISNLFVPAGLTFSIWGVIYLFLLLFAVFQSRGLFRAGQNAPAGVLRIGWLFVLSSAANIGWLLLWHYELVGLSMIAMLVLLGSLLAMYVRLGTGRTRTSSAERWLLRVPFSLYVGWITVATIANATAFLVTIGWNGFGLPPEAWAVAVVVVAALVTLAVLLTRRDAAYGLVVLWARAGIALKRSGDATSASQVVFVAAIACGAVVAAAIIASAVRSAVRPLSHDTR
jgi:benzodiazapine receptor